MGAAVGVCGKAWCMGVVECMMGRAGVGMCTWYWGVSMCASNGTGSG